MPISRLRPGRGTCAAVFETAWGEKQSCHSHRRGGTRTARRSVRLNVSVAAVWFVGDRGRATRGIRKRQVTTARPPRRTKGASAVRISAAGPGAGRRRAVSSRLRRAGSGRVRAPRRAEAGRAARAPRRRAVRPARGQRPEDAHAACRFGHVGVRRATGGRRSRAGRPGRRSGAATTTFGAARCGLAFVRAGFGLAFGRTGGPCRWRALDGGVYRLRRRRGSGRRRIRRLGQPVAPVTGAARRRVGCRVWGAGSGGAGAGS